MAVEVFKFELSSPQDTSGMADALASGRLKADDIVAAIGKTEGNGGVNDFSRILADQTYRKALVEAGSRSAEQMAAMPMVWSGGCDGVITPHVNLFARTAERGPETQSRLAIGAALSEEILPEDIGRPAMIEKIAAGVRACGRRCATPESKTPPRSITSRPRRPC
jgi:cyanuric acid amidohydrolase